MTIIMGIMTFIIKSSKHKKANNNIKDVNKDNKQNGNSSNNQLL